ncbi:MAG: hypothetical protein UX31_C0017G0002 [Candidatus Nomurabacteria bacterium GW2011_GWA1_46_11]|uniref:Uncharacterized protein n=2 Tax=Parcubacteria group TaxID=1794811 RepID=A0A1G1YXD9_9BACT|nr:MAG: hypothetical protein UX29_C0005G0002 [Parcubacteria group bacterium GW2011_GWA2_46_10]KKU21418.1 MAG: hypothetical protein UX31_C0017G0002 [Candidatus Nomurabacteria bacterium GW2011_GWA1_46_11]OGY56320.1 MAG: hypothetical protein A2119_02000 [Candidatus Colwellbacteria bacterium GWA2_46_10]
MKRLFNAIVDKLLGFHLGSAKLDLNDLTDVIAKMGQWVTYIVLVILVAVYVLGSTIIDAATLTAWTAVGYIATVLVVWLGFTKVILVILGIDYSVPKALRLFRKEKDGETKPADSKGKSEILALLGRFEHRLEDVGGEVVSDLRKGFRNIAVVLLAPTGLALWGWGVHFQENDALLPLVVATAMLVPGLISAPKSKWRRIAWFLFILIVGSFTVYTMVRDPETPFHRWFDAAAENWPSTGGEEGSANQLALFSPTTLRSDCVEPVQIEPRYPGNGVTEYLVGPLSMGCTTEIFKPDRGGWDAWKIVPQDRGSWATIKFSAGGPPFTFVCEGPEVLFPDQWPDFSVVDGAGYLIVVLWDSGFTENPEYPCDEG